MKFERTVFGFIFSSLNQLFFFWLTFFRNSKIFQKNIIQKKVQRRPKFKRMTFFFRNEFRKNDHLILKECYLIKQPIPRDTGGTFYSSYFDNSNQRPFVWRLRKNEMFDSDLVQLISPKNKVKQNIIWTKSQNKFSLINVNFDGGSVNQISLDQNTRLKIFSCTRSN